jgi:hypothetical protein
MSADSDGATSPLMTPDETSECLGLTTAQLQADRERNVGPEFYTISPRLIRYDRADVIRHIPTGTPCPQP